MAFLHCINWRPVRLQVTRLPSRHYVVSRGDLEIGSLRQRKSADATTYQWCWSTTPTNKEDPGSGEPCPAWRDYRVSSSFRTAMLAVARYRWISIYNVQNFGTRVSMHRFEVDHIWFTVCQDLHEDGTRGAPMVFEDFPRWLTKPDQRGQALLRKLLAELERRNLVKDARWDIE